MCSEVIRSQETVGVGTAKVTDCKTKNVTLGSVGSLLACKAGVKTRKLVWLLRLRQQHVGARRRREERRGEAREDAVDC
jgi:hypothetical protein